MKRSCWISAFSGGSFGYNQSYYLKRLAANNNKPVPEARLLL